MTYVFKRQKQYWIEVWQDGQKIGDLTRGGSYRWFVMVDGDARMLLQSYDNLALAKEALAAHMLRRNKKRKR